MSDIKPDLSFTKDMADIIKAKILVFNPFFGAFMVFIIGKSEYIKDTNFVVWIITFATLVTSIFYINIASSLLWSLGSARTVWGKHFDAVTHHLPISDKDKEALDNIVKIMHKQSAVEDRWYRRVMWLFYLCAFMVLYDIYFEKWLLPKVNDLIGTALK